METVDSEVVAKENGSSDNEQYDEVDDVEDAALGQYEKRDNHDIGSSVSTKGRDGLEDGVIQESQEENVEAEDGEILEDGEIDDDEGGVEELEDNHEAIEAKHNYKYDEENYASVQGDEERGNLRKEESESDGVEEEPSKEKRRKDRKKRKRQREKEKKKKSKEESKRKRKRHEYVDFDNVDQEYQYQPKVRRRSPPGPYDSPYQSPDENLKTKRSPPEPYESPYRSPPGPYDSPPESPPGPYDSPPDDSDEEERYGDGSNHRKRPKKSMLGMLDDNYLDPNIAVSEKQDLFQAAVRGRGRARGKPMKVMPQQPRKKPLLETPRAARPACKFYKEGKCAKGSQCPFNHDFTPPKKPDICKFYLNSTCNKGRDCIYMHGEYPCKFFHTGTQCYGGDNCKFSHDPLTPETYPLLNKILDNDDEDFQPKAPRPSLLGSPPRHVKEAAERMKGLHDQTKKIPSLLDIEVFPPKQSPQKQQLSPNKEQASPKPGSLHCRPGFYTETAPPQTGYNPAVLALGALLNQAANHSPSARYPFQSPNSQSFGHTDVQHSDVPAGKHETEDSEVDNSQDTQKLDDDDSQEDKMGAKAEDGTSDEDRRHPSFEVPSHLPPKQRELFMRIHQQQREETVQPDGKRGDDEPVDDDDWYSSDEEETGENKPKLVDMLRNISQSATQSTLPQSDTQEQAQPKLGDASSGKGSFDILQMLNAIRGQSSTGTTSGHGSVPSASQLLGSLVPQTSSESVTRTEKTPPHQTELPEAIEHLPKVPKDGSELPYKVITISVSKTLYLPPNLNLSDPRVSSDPRVQGYSSRGGAPKFERQTSNKSSSDTDSTEVSSSKPTDPRHSQTGSVEGSATVNPADPRKLRPSAKSEGLSDPRRAKDNSANSEDQSKSSDPRLQRSMTEQIQSNVARQDPRLQKSQSNPTLGTHNLPVRPPIMPGFPRGFPRPPPGGPLRPMGGPPRPPGGRPMGPRNMRPPLLRTPLMPDGSFRPRGPRPFMDPRLGRQNSGEMHFGPPPSDPRARPQGMSPGRDHVGAFGPSQNDPRLRPMGMSPNHDQPTVSPNDPRMRQGKPANSETSNFSQNPSDPRLKLQGQFSENKAQTSKNSDPRLGRQSGSLDSSSASRSSDPRLLRQTAIPPAGLGQELRENSEDSDPPSGLDPRSQRRAQPDSALDAESNMGSPRIKKKKFIGQRKGSMEYSSPLGIGSDQPDPALSGFSSYNRPPGNRLQPSNNKQRAGGDAGSSSRTASSNITDLHSNNPRLKQSSYSNSPTYSGYHSPGPLEQDVSEDVSKEHVELPASLQAPPPPLKELFKTIDPTASPFC